MNTYKNIFKEYNTKENIPFLLLNRRVVFPEDESLPIYNNRYISSDTPWTILSYQIYNDIIFPYEKDSYFISIIAIIFWNCISN